MRVTNSMAQSSLMHELSRNLESYRNLNQQISSGKKLLIPSDDPTGVALSNRYSTSESSYSKYQDNISEAEEFLTATD